MVRKEFKIVVVAILVFLLGCVVMFKMIESSYSTVSDELETLKASAESYKADIQKEHQKRFEYLPNLELIMTQVDNKDIIVQEIREARAQYNEAYASSDIAGMIKADKEIEAVITKFQEEYPEIAAIDIYQDFIEEYFGNEVTVEVKNYNEVVRRYNNMVRNFPTSIVAKGIGYEPMSEF